MARMTPAEASRELARTCPVIDRLYRAAGPCRLHAGAPRGPRGHFAALVSAIVSQQITGKVARVIHARVIDALGGEVTPDALLATKLPRLRKAGLSGSKAASLCDLARKATDGTLALDRLGRMGDDELIERLVLVRGIGPWTAQMFLMFQLQRLDVWPVLDFGVRKGFALAYGLDAMPTPRELEPLGERFRPYRSIAAWYCWRAIETVLPMQDAKDATKPRAARNVRVPR